LTEKKPPVAILCGGRGTRLREETVAIPKALVDIGGKPILWHVIRIYLDQGFDRFFLLTGYRGEMIADWAESESWDGPVAIEAVPTGEETPTGGRIKLAESHLGGERFCATYADGVADIDLAALLDFHAGHGDLATLTLVRPRLQFGLAQIDDSDRVTAFEEKPMLDTWINGGFFCFEPGALDYIQTDSVLEREPLQKLASDAQLHGFRHERFWDCMDTYKDAVELNDLWSRGEAPWLTPGEARGSSGR
jgi:glucose-1-phosphate cytidylyltransferase